MLLVGQHRGGPVEIPGLLAATGLAGGLGHQGLVCGALSGALLVLGLSPGPPSPGAATRLAQAFVEAAGSLYCRQISNTDFEEARQLRKYLFKACRCLRAVRSASRLLGTHLPQGVPSPQPLEPTGFHCAPAVLREFSRLTGIGEPRVEAASVVYDAGVAGLGATCGALIGGVLGLGLRYGADGRRNSRSTALKCLAITLAGGQLFERERLNNTFKAGRLTRQLVIRFRETFGSTECRQLCGLDQPRLEELSERRLNHCRNLAAVTAGMAAEIMPAGGK